jgi:hypothetical protein
MTTRCHSNFNSARDIATADPALDLHPKRRVGEASRN